MSEALSDRLHETVGKPYAGIIFPALWPNGVRKGDSFHPHGPKAKITAQLTGEFAGLVTCWKNGQKPIRLSTYLKEERGWDLKHCADTLCRIAGVPPLFKAKDQKATTHSRPLDGLTSTPQSTKMGPAAATVGPEEQPKNSGIIGTQYLAERGVLLAEGVEIEQPPSAEKIIDRLRFHSDEAVSLAADSESIYLVSLPERGGKDQAMGRAASANPF